MFGEIREMHPLLTPKLTNATIKRAVSDYLNGGARKQRVVIKYGDIPSVTGTDGLDWGRKAGGKMGWMTPTPIIELCFTVAERARDATVAV